MQPEQLKVISLRELLMIASFMCDIVQESFLLLCGFYLISKTIQKTLSFQNVFDSTYLIIIFFYIAYILAIVRFGNNRLYLNKIFP